MLVSLQDAQWSTLTALGSDLHDYILLTTLTACYPVSLHFISALLDPSPPALLSQPVVLRSLPIYSASCSLFSVYSTPLPICLQLLCFSWLLKLICSLFPVAAPLFPLLHISSKGCSYMLSLPAALLSLVAALLPMQFLAVFIICFPRFSSAFSACCSLRYSLFAVRCSPFAVSCSLLTVSLLLAHFVASENCLPTYSCILLFTKFKHSGLFPPCLQLTAR